ncbi:hypothetical protein ACJX0J_039255 [Zea mays]
MQLLIHATIWNIFRRFGISLFIQSSSKQYRVITSNTEAAQVDHDGRTPTFHLVCVLIDGMLTLGSVLFCRQILGSDLCLFLIAYLEGNISNFHSTLALMENKYINGDKPKLI